MNFIEKFFIRREVSKMLDNLKTRLSKYAPGIVSTLVAALVVASFFYGQPIIVMGIAIPPADAKTAGIIVLHACTWIIAHLTHKPSPLTPPAAQ